MMAVFQKVQNCTFQVSTLKLVAFSGSLVKIRFNLRGGISHKGPKSSFIVARVALPYSFFGPGVKIRTNPRDGGFPKRLKLYISSLKVAGFSGSGEKIRFHLRGGMSTQGPKIVIYSGTYSTFLFDSFF